MINLYIVYTIKTPSPHSEWTNVHDSNHAFATMQEAKQFLKEMYCHCKKRTAMYLDTVSQGTIQHGYIYHYKDKDNGKTTYHQDWVGFNGTQAIDLRKKEPTP